MRLLLRERLSFETPLSPAEALQRLSAAVEPRRLLRWPLRMLPRSVFTGRINGNRFTVTLAAEDDEHPSPVILGEVSPSPSGARVDAGMRPRLTTLAGIAVLWGFGITFIAVRWADTRTALIGAALFMGFPYLVCLFNFRRGGRDARQRLQVLQST